MENIISLCDQLGIKDKIYDIRDVNGNIIYLEFRMMNGVSYWGYLEYGNNNVIIYNENSNEVGE